MLLKYVRRFIIDFSAPAVFLAGYQFARGFAPDISHVVNVYPMIHFDEALFGFLPTVRLQSILATNNQIHFYDYIGTFLYMAYFIIPFTFAVYLWFKKKKVFYPYVYGMLLLSYLAFITYVVFPAMPPWLASARGYIPPIKRILDLTYSHVSTGVSMNLLDQIFGANLVAAVPSLHAADPTLMCLFLFYQVKKIFRPLLVIYPIAVGFFVVYLGEHYVFDVLMGVLYAVCTYLIIINRAFIYKEVKGGVLFIKTRLTPLIAENN